VKIEDIKTITATNVKVEGKAIVEATIENVYALDVLQAEYRAEVFLSDLADSNEQVNSCDRWELVKAGDGKLETWTVRFFAAPANEAEPQF
jgi:hypothetical protein